MEWSLDIHTIFFIEFSLGGFTLPLINIDYFPLLVNLSILVLITLDVSSLRISGSLNIQEFVLVINSIDVSTISLEHLPPS